MKIRLNLKALGMVAATYLAFAFGTWHLNPGLWAEEARVCAATIALIVACAAVACDE